VDLEARTRSFFTAMGQGDPAEVLAFFSPGAVYDVQGVLAPMDKSTFERYLRGVRQRLPQARFNLESITVKRNVAFVEWSRAGRRSDGSADLGHGLHVLSWDQDGLITHATVHTRLPVLQQADLQ
jgi:hypothetical protein